MTYNEEVKQEILSMKDVISFKKFYNSQEEEFNKTNERHYLLTQSIDNLTLIAYNNAEEYVDEFVFSVDYAHSYGRVQFGDWMITNAPISLLYENRYQRRNYE